MSKVESVELQELNYQIKVEFADFLEAKFSLLPPQIYCSEVIGDYGEVSLINSSTGAKLKFVYAPALGFRPESISIFIENKAGDTFSVGEYLESKNRSEEERLAISLSKQEGVACERISKVLKAAKKIIIGSELLDCLVAGKWISVPVQWGDLK